MNILRFLESFTDDSLLQSESSRRNSFAQFGEIGKKTALAAIPGGLLAFLIVPGKSSANTLFTTTDDENSIVAALQLALTLEYLDGTFYQMGLDTPGLIPQGRDRDSFAKIALNEKGHAQTIKNALNSLGNGHVFEAPEFDYTGGQGSGQGPFDPFGDYQQFLAMSQAFEDTGVKAMKGQAPNLMSNKDILQAALQLHSAESRQAAEVRQLRGMRGWIMGNEVQGVPAAMQPAAQLIYGNEMNTNQGSVNAAGVTASSGEPALTANAAAQAFDEILTRQQVITIASPFLPQGQMPMPG